MLQYQILKGEIIMNQLTPMQKTMYEFLKQTYDNLVKKVNLTQQEKHELELCKDLLKAFEVGQDLHDPNTSNTDKMKSLSEAAQLLNKYFPIQY
jgi:ribosomal protein L16 Arg81 hydroxylase